MSVNLGAAERSRGYYIGSNEVKKIYKGSTSVYQALIKDNLVLHIDAAYTDCYPGTGTTIFNLASGGPDATLAGGATFNNTASARNGAFHIRNTGSEHISFGDLTGDANIEMSDFTISLWFKKVGSGFDKDLISMGTHSTNKPLLIFMDGEVSTAADLGVANERTIAFLVYDGDTQHWISSPTDSIANDGTYNLVCQHNTSGEGKIYINNVEVASDTKSGANGIQVSSNPLRIGIDSANAFDADIDVYALHVYKSYLTADEISQNYHNLKDRIFPPQ